ncbi:MAG: hypothetical protein JXX28_14605, partial [Deltaproteobacteria bacterium]|nr:hypothetical protein [Deltaproteobacteria bacterium]
MDLPAAVGSEVVLEAPAIALNGGTARAVGPVRLSGRWDLTCEGATLEGGTLSLGAGRWDGPPGAVQFASAEVDLAQGLVSLRGVGLVWGAGWVEAEALQVGARTAGQGVSWRPCGPEGWWAVRAAEVTVLPGEALVLRGAQVALPQGMRLPVPVRRVPLIPADRPLPRLGFGRDGLVLGVPVRRGPALLEAEGRWERGARALLEVDEWGAGAVGWDTQEGGARGAARWRAAGEGRSGWALSEGELLSDPDYLTDYGDSFLDRGAVARLGRITAGSGPLRAWGVGAQEPDGAVAPLGAGGGVDLAGDWRWGLVGRARAGGQWRPVQGALGVGALDLGRPTRLGVAVLRPSLWERVGLDGGRAGGAGLGVALPLWGVVGGRSLRLVPALALDAGWGDEAPWTARGGVRWQRGVDQELLMSASVGPERWGAEARGRWRAGPVEVMLWGEAGPETAAAWGRLGWSLGPAALAGELVLLGEVAEGSGSLSAPLWWGLTAEAAAAWELAAGRWTRGDAALWWGARAGCPELGVRGRVAVD